MKPELELRPASPQTPHRLQRTAAPASRAPVWPRHLARPSATEMTTHKPCPYSAASRCRDTLVKAGFGNTPGRRSLLQVSNLGSLSGPILPLHQITSEGDAVRNACILTCLGESPLLKDLPLEDAGDKALVGPQH